MRGLVTTLALLVPMLPSSALADERSAKAAEAGVLERQDEGLVATADYCFSIGKSQASVDSESAWNGAEKHAGVRALALYLSEALRIDDAPAVVPAALLEDFRRRASVMIIERLELVGVETVAEFREPGLVARVVKAVGTEQLRRETRTWDGCLGLVRDSSLAGHEADAALWAELRFVLGEPVDEAVEAWTKAVSRSPGVAATIGRQPIPMTDGWLRLPLSLEPERVRGLSAAELLRLLDRRPFDDQLVEELQGRFRESGRSVIADAIGKWHCLGPARDACECLQATAGSAKTEPDQLKGLEIVLRHPMTWPFFEETSPPPAASAAFDKGDISNAALLLAQKLGDRPDPDSASLLSACLFLEEEFEAAESLARMAYTRHPRHAHAGVNLARALEKLDRVYEAAAIAVDVEKNATLDAWGREEAARIRADANESETSGGDVGAPPPTSEGSNGHD